MFDMVDTPFSYERGLIVCSSLQEFSKTKESTLRVISNVDTAFLLCEAELWIKIKSGKNATAFHALTHKFLTQVYHQRYHTKYFLWTKTDKKANSCTTVS